MLTISDELLSESRMAEDEARVEIACRLFDAGKLTFPVAARWALLSRRDFEQELLNRGLPLVRISDESLDEDLRTLQKLA